MLKQIDAAWWHKLNGGLRHALAHDFGLFGPRPLVNEYPKSGGGWMAQLLAAGLDLPFPRNRLPVLRPAVLHGHLMPGRGMRNVVLVWRDGRDVMVSWYFHAVVGNELASKRRREALRARLGIETPEDVRTNLPRFIEHAMTDARQPRFTWPAFADAWAGRDDAIHVRYEDLLADAAGELRRVAAALNRPIEPERAARVAEGLNFKAQTGRASGEENAKSYLRKGVAGDWRNHFSDEAEAVFERHAGEALRRLGYA